MAVIEINEAKFRAQAAKDGVTHFSTGVAVARNGSVLVVRRAVHDHLGGAYELPGGGVDEGETFAQSAVRELLEETGLKATKILGWHQAFDYQTPQKPKVRQINFTVQTEPGEITLDPNEHDSYKWIGPKGIAGLESTDSMKNSLHEIFKQAI